MRRCRKALSGNLGFIPTRWFHHEETADPPARVCRLRRPCRRARLQRDAHGASHRGPRIRRVRRPRAGHPERAENEALRRFAQRRCCSMRSAKSWQMAGRGRSRRSTTKPPRSAMTTRPRSADARFQRAPTAEPTRRWQTDVHVVPPASHQLGPRVALLPRHERARLERVRGRGRRGQHLAVIPTR